MTKDTELAWAAGFFDGEGSIFSYIPKDRKTARIRITMVQKDREVLDRFQKAVGGYGKIYVAKTRNQFVYQVWTPTEVVVVMGMIWEFLSSIKKDAYKKAFGACKEQFNER